MGARDPRLIAPVPGRLVKDPTDLTVAFPHGGTELGTYRDVLWKPSPAWFEVKAEEFGHATSDVLDCGESPYVVAVLRAFDEDAIAALFPNLTSAGTFTRRKGMVGHAPDPAGTTRAGTMMSSRGIKLLCAPLDPDRHRALLVYRAIPLVQDVLELPWNFVKPQEVPVLFVGIPDATGRTYAHHFLRDMTGGLAP